MAKKRKGARGQDGEADASPASKPAPAVATKLSALLSGVKLPAKPAKSGKLEPPPRTLPPIAPAKPQRVPPAPGSLPPPPPARGRSTAELSALNDAYRGVRPLDVKKPSRLLRKPSTPPPRDLAAEAADHEARERLGALIGGGVRFDVQLDEGGFVQALRQGASTKVLGALGARDFRPEATCDLHGQRKAEALRSIHDFVRAQHKRGARKLLLIVGKGLHSADGNGVLGEVAREALTRGGAAPLVQAFRSAHEHHGGRGAIAVLLR